MAHIELQKVDYPDVIYSNFESRMKHLSVCENKITERYRIVAVAHKICAELLQRSVVVKPDISEQKKWFNYGLNCIAEIGRTAHLEGKEVEINIEFLPPFTLEVNDFHEVGDITRALHWARIARNTSKEKYIADFPLELLGNSSEPQPPTSTLPRDLQSAYIDYLTHLEFRYTKKRVFDTELFEKMVDLYDKMDITAHAQKSINCFIHYLHPWVHALKSFTEDDEEAFHHYLLEALQKHKEVWGQKIGLNRGDNPFLRSHEGFLSWECTSLAAMAYDKGWQLQVTSDYMPNFMVDGSINQ